METISHSTLAMLAVINPFVCGAMLLQIEQGKDKKDSIIDGVKAMIIVLIILLLSALTGRYLYQTDLISFRVAVVISTISGRLDSSALSYSFGFGGSFSGWMKIKKQGRFYFSLTSGSAVSHFMDMFDGKGKDLAYNPNTQKFKPLISTGGYLAYSYNFPKSFSASLSFGMAAITNKDFQPDEDYSYSFNALLNVFWTPVNGARVGIEYANGQRFDKGGAGARGMANRLSVLLYYDF